MGKSKDIHIHATQQFDKSIVLNNKNVRTTAKKKHRSANGFDCKTK